MKRFIHYITVALGVLVWFFLPLSIAADELESELSHVQSQMEEIQRKKELAEIEIGSVSEVLRQIQVELDSAMAELRKVENQLSLVMNKIGELEKELAAAEKRLQEREKVLNKRLRDIYIHGKLNYLEVIMGAKNFSDFSNRMEFLKRIITSDLTLIGEIKKERALILLKKQELEAQKKELVELENKARKQKDKIEDKKEEQLIVLERLQNEKALAEQSYAELQSTSESIKARIQARQHQGISSSQAVHGTGQLIWPAHGPITSPFGYRIHPIFGTQIFHSGIDLGIDTGTPVLAADSGVVVEAGWISGYGYTVIIDHGNGLSTLYAHNSEVTVSPGQSVSQGQVICYSGSTGYSTGPHLHFEVRLNGSPVNPLGYL